MSITLAPHQVEAIAKLRTGSVLVGGVGSGKSIASLAYFSQKAPQRPIIVVTTAKKRDSGEWYADAMKMSLRTDLEVVTWNKIKDIEDVNGKSIIFDEQRIVGKGAWVDAFLKISKNNDWILLSATPADTYMDLVPLFLAHGFFRNRTDFHNQHVRWDRYSKFPKVDRYIDPYILDEYRRQIYVEMPFERHTTREQHILHVDYYRDEEVKIHRDRWNIYTSEPIKDAGEMMRVLRRSVNSHWSRYEQVKTLVKDNPRVIVFYNHNYELELLRCLHTEMDVPVAEWNGHNHQDIPNTDRWVYLVQYQAGSEGWNCTTTDTVVFYSLPYSYRNFEQAKGRIDRMDTKYEVLNYYVLKSTSIIDRAIWRSLERKKNFNISAFVKKAWPKERKFTPLN